MSDFPKSKQQFQECSSKITDFLSNIVTLVLLITAAISIAAANGLFHFLDDAWAPIFAVLSRCCDLEEPYYSGSVERLLLTHSAPLLVLGAVQSILIRSKKQLRWVLLLSSVVSILFTISAIPLYTYYSNDMFSETTQRAINWTVFFVMLSLAGLLIAGFLVSRWIGRRWQTELATISCARAVQILILRSAKVLTFVGCAYLIIVGLADVTTPPPRPAGPAPLVSPADTEEPFFDSTDVTAPPPRPADPAPLVSPDPKGPFFDSTPYRSQEFPKGVSSSATDQTVVNKETPAISALIAGKVLHWGKLLLIALALVGLLWGLERKLLRQTKLFAS